MNASSPVVMKRQLSTAAAIIVAGLSTGVLGQSASTGSVASIHHAKGAFGVKLTPMPAADYADGRTLGRALADKQDHGDLEGSGKGQMLTATGEVNGSAVYVATERVTGTLS